MIILLDALRLLDVEDLFDSEKVGSL